MLFGVLVIACGENVTLGDLNGIDQKKFMHKSQNGHLSKDDIVGTYVMVLFVEGPFYWTEIDIRPDGTYTFWDGTVRLRMPDPGCEGTYQIKKRSISRHT